MTIPAIVQVSVAAFILVSWAIFTAIGARFFLKANSATVELGIGPELFVLHLNRFTYRIHLVPAFIGEVRVPVKNFQWLGLFLPTIVGLLLLALALIHVAIRWSPADTERSLAVAVIAQKLHSTDFALIEDVKPGTEAMKAGLMQGMVILRVNGHSIGDGSELIRECAVPGKEIQFETATIDQLASMNRFHVTVPHDPQKSLGLRYVFYTKFDVAGATRVSELKHASAGVLHESWRAWVDVTLLNRLDRMQLKPDAQMSVFALNASAAILAFLVLYAAYASISGLGHPKYFPVFVALLSAFRPGHFILGLVILIALAVSRRSINPRVLIWMSVICFWIFHVYSIYAGLYTGLLIEVAKLNHMAIEWSI